MKVFVVNRKKDLERRQYIIDHFKENGINDYEFFDAVDGSKLSDSYVNRCRSLLSTIIMKGKKINRGELGCALSHLGIYEKIISNNMPGALVFEDDAVIKKPNLIENVEKSTRFLGESASVISYGYLSSKGAVSIPYEIKKLRKLSRTHCYYINQKGAKNMISAYGDYPFMPIDKFKQLRKMGALKLYSSKEYLCSFKDDGSIIDSISSGTEFRRNDIGFIKARAIEIVKFLVENIYFPLKSSRFEK